jgi:MFS family permease
VPSDRVTPSAVTLPRSTQFRVVGVVLLAALFGGFVFNGVSISLPKLFDERLGALAQGLSGIGGYSALVFAVAAFAQLPVGALLDRFGGRPVLLTLLAFEVAALVATAMAGGALVLPSALVTVTLMFAGIPITGWLIAKYVATSWRARVFALEYVLALGMSAMIVPLMAVLLRSGYGFDRQYLFFALSAAVVVAAALALPWPPAGRRAIDKAGIRP